MNLAVKNEKWNYVYGSNASSIRNQCGPAGVHVYVCVYVHLYNLQSEAQNKGIKGPHFVIQKNVLGFTLWTIGELLGLGW